MQFEVPQFIDIEDKIFGPLTWRQFLYLGGGIGMAVVIFIIAPFFIFIFVGLPLAILSGALAFYPINNRPFSFILEAVFNYLGSNKLYLWRKKEDIIHKSVFTPKSLNEGSESKEQIDITKKSNLSSLSRRLQLEALQKKE